MDVALALFRYFPHGGLQRDFMAVARCCVQRGLRVSVLAAEWQGDPPEGMTLVRLPVQGTGNHARMRHFARALAAWRLDHPVSVLAGFNRLPGLDLYFASDSCFAAQLAPRPRVLRWLPRYRTYLNLEAGVCGPDGAARILFLSRQQANGYLDYYDLPESRYRILPPGLRADRRRDEHAGEYRRQIRNEFGITDDQSLVLFLGSGFRVKGLDRAIEALAALPEGRREQVRLLVVGDDDPAPFRRRLAAAGLEQQTLFAGGRDDVPALLQAADLLLHPAYRESAGMVLLEATVAGLPVLTTASCGYAEYVDEAGSGEVLPEPFSQQALNDTLAHMLARVPGDWSRAGIDYGRDERLYRLHDAVAEEIETFGKR